MPLELRQNGPFEMRAQVRVELRSGRPRTAQEARPQAGRGPGRAGALDPQAPDSATQVELADDGEGDVCDDCFTSDAAFMTSVSPSVRTSFQSRTTATDLRMTRQATTTTQRRSGALGHPLAHICAGMLTCGASA
jgi:hypothetical protein